MDDPINLIMMEYVRTEESCLVFKCFFLPSVFFFFSPQDTMLHRISMQPMYQDINISLLFFLNWKKSTIDPQHPHPLLLWDFQSKAILWIHGPLGKH